MSPPALIRVIKLLLRRGWALDRIQQPNQVQLRLGIAWIRGNDDTLFASPHHHSDAGKGRVLISSFLKLISFG